MFRNKQYSVGAERGMSLTGLIGGLAVLGVAGVFGMKLVPAYLEYSTIKAAIVKAKEAGGTVREMQTAFDRNAGVNDVEAIRGRDLIITRDNGEPDISFAYEKRVPLAGNVSLLIDFAGTTDPSGVVAERNLAAQ
ncbi:DUF4845 domain-containing protein [Massilia niastensis]|uniref:DUF4845 domain-containing protein n=1 Tax=Massilia niastensis TaxID=544911 RepID=UPI0003829816|nr:DUF4845 domain-containing protein [Massilia niastensis]